MISKEKPLPSGKQHFKHMQRRELLVSVAHGERLRRLEECSPVPMSLKEAKADSLKPTIQSSWADSPHLISMFTTGCSTVKIGHECGLSGIERG